MNNPLCFSVITLLFCGSVIVAGQPGKIVYAVNAGGDSHTDSNNIKYLADTLTIGVQSNYGQRQSIARIPAQDNILYQTERWHDQNFAYEIPVKDDGDYVLVLKFAEVFFYAANQKVFDVHVNDHVVLRDIDIFRRVGHSAAHDEVIPLTINNGKLSVNGEYSTFNGLLKVEFVKGAADNPKICAFYLMKGVPDDVPKLSNFMKSVVEDVEVEDEEDMEYEEQETPSRESSSPSRKNKLKSGPPASDPYAEDNCSLFVPIAIAFAVFFPTLFCLCRL